MNAPQVPSEQRTVTVTYTVDNVGAPLLEITNMADPRRLWRVGELPRVHAVGDDGSTLEWQLRNGDPQPVIGSRFVRTVIVEDQ